MSALALATVLALAARPDCGGGHGVEPQRLAAVAQAESAFDPLFIHVNGPGGGEIQPATFGEAVAHANALLSRGRSVDLGLMQINSANLAQHGLTIATAFDACASMRAGVEHLAADHAWVLAHERYNCGRTDCGAAYAVRVARIQAQIAQAQPLEPSLENGEPVPAQTDDTPMQDLVVHRLPTPPQPSGSQRVGERPVSPTLMIARTE